MKAVYKAIHPDGPRRKHLWERTVFLIPMPARPDNGDPSDLQAVAERVARSKECEYLAVSGGRVQWTFQGIEDIQRVLDPDFEEGTEVYWEFFYRVDKIPST